MTIKKIPAICMNCINYINEMDDTKKSCDYEYWENINVITSTLYTPEMFECLNFEYNLDIQEKLNREKNNDKLQ